MAPEPENDADGHGSGAGAEKEKHLGLRETDWKHLQPELPWAPVDVSSPADEHWAAGQGQPGAEDAPEGAQGFGDSTAEVEDGVIDSEAAASLDGVTVWGAAPADRWRTPTASLLVFAGLVAGLYASLATALVRDEALAYRVVRSLPVIGSVLAPDQAVIKAIVLADVEGVFARLHGGKEVFVVRGRVLNTTSRAVRGVHIEVRLLDGEGRELRRQTAPWGGVLSRRIIGELTPRELENLKRVAPGAQFRVEPGRSAPFTLAFLNPPAAAAEYTSRVIAAEWRS